MEGEQPKLLEQLEVVRETTHKEALKVHEKVNHAVCDMSDRVKALENCSAGNS